MLEHINQYSMTALCQALCVSRSGYYAWHKRRGQRRPLLQAVSHAFAAHKARAGAPTLAKDLHANGVACSPRNVGRALAKLGLKAKGVRKYKPAGSNKQRHNPSPDLLERQFSVQKPNVVWVCDITYIRTSEGWLYLAVVLDLYSRQVVGWQIDTRMQDKLACEALQAAVAVRGNPRGVTVHSDQGSQYCSHAFRRLIKKHHMLQSMSRKGNCFDNAVAESFFATLKKLAIYGNPLKNRIQTKEVVFEFIEAYYNRVRRHSNNNWLSPVQFESLYYQQLQDLTV